MKKINIFLFNMYILTLSLNYIVDEGFYRLSLVVSLIIFFLQLFIFDKDIKTNPKFYKSLFFFTGLLLLGTILNQIFVLKSINGIFKIVDVLGQIGIALLLLNNMISLRNIQIIYFLFVFFYSFHIFYGTDPNTIYNQASRNLTSFIMIFLTILLLTFYYQEKNKIVIYPLIINTIICIWAIGRTGILLSFFLLIGVILVKLFKDKKHLYSKILKMKKNKKYHLIILIIFLSLLGVLIYSIPKIMGILAKYRFTLYSIEHEKRFEYIFDYFKHLDVKTLLLGFNNYEVSNIFNIANLHNSYLSGHMRMGIMFVIALVIILMMILKGFKIQPLYSVFLVIILLRGFTDTILFNGNFDFILYYLLFKLYYD